MAYERERMRAGGNTSYVYGNTAARQAAPAAPEKSEKELRREKKQYIESSRQTIENKVTAGRRAACDFSLPQTMVFAAAIVTLTAFCLMYISQLSLNRELKSSAATYMAQLQSLNADNVLLENENNARIDYDAVYAYATETLGMQTPEKHQVVRYEQRSSEYVQMNGEIPND